MPQKLVIEAEVNDREARAQLENLGDAANSGMDAAADAAGKMSDAADKTASAMGKVSGGALQFAGSIQRTVHLMSSLGSGLANLGAGIANIAGGGDTGIGKFFNSWSDSISRKGFMTTTADSIREILAQDTSDVLARRAANTANRAEFLRVTTGQKQDEEFAKTLKSLADSTRSAAERFREADTLVKKFATTLAKQDRLIGDATRTRGGSPHNFALLMRERQPMYSRLQAMRAVRERLQDAMHESAPEATAPRANAIVDSLQQLGLSVAAGGGADARMEQVQKDQLAELKELNKNVKNIDGSSKWQ